SAPLATVLDWKVPSELVHEASLQISKATLPLSLGSGSLNVALSDGVAVLTRAASGGATGVGVVGAAFAVLFVTATPTNVAGGLPWGGALPRTTGPPGCV